MQGIPIPGGTLAETTRFIARALAAAGLSAAPSEARWLMGAALGLSAAELLSRSDDVVTDAQRERLTSYLTRRLHHEPLSRITGAREFYGRSFEVTDDTLDPRPDTETLIDAALEMLGPEVQTRPLRVLDIGTGTGCILLTLLAELPNATGVATDISDSALVVAARNAQRLGVADRVTFTATDLATGIDGPFDLVVSNPPYIRSGDIAGLSAAVRDFDPLSALDGGDDGLVFYRRITRELVRLLPDGFVLFETGYDQAAAVADLLQTSDIAAPPRTFNDVAGIPRVVAARTRRLR